MVLGFAAFLKDSKYCVGGVQALFMTFNRNSD